jgi:hypothetical protein
MSVSMDTAKKYFFFLIYICPISKCIKILFTIYLIYLFKLSLTTYSYKIKNTIILLI